LSRKLPLKAAIGVKTPSLNKFMEVYGKDYCDVVIEEQECHTFLEKLANFPSEIDIIFISEDIFHPYFPNKEQATALFRKSIPEVVEAHKERLIHIHLHNTSAGEYPELTKIESIYETIFSDRGPTKKEIEERLAQRFNLPFADIRNFRKERDKSRNTQYPGQMDIDDVIKKDIANNKDAETIVFEHPNETIDLLKGLEWDGQPAKPEQKESNLTPTKESSAAPISIETDPKPATIQTTKKEEVKQSAPPLTIREFNELSPDQKEGFKHLVQKAIFDRGDYFKIKQSLRNAILHKNIGILNLYKRAGSSFIANNLALSLAKEQVSVGVLEAQQPFPSLYYRLGGTEQEPDGWESWYRNVKRNNWNYSYNNETYDLSFVSPELDWKKDGVHWIPYLPPQHKSESTASILDTLTIYYTADAIPILLIDLSDDMESGFSRFILEEVDELWVIVEPELHLFAYQQEKLRKIHNYVKTSDVYYIVNKTHEFTDKSTIVSHLTTFESFINPEPLSYIPYSPSFAKGDAERTFAYLLTENQPALSEAFIPLYQRVMTEETYHSFVHKHTSTSKNKRFWFREGGTQ
jgi:hypothetical protein